MSRVARLFALALAVKSAYWLLLTGAEAVTLGDAFSYLEPLDRLAEGGPYTYDVDYLPGYAGRMPGLAPLYLPLRLVLPIEEARWAYAAAQVVLDAVACVLIWQVAGLFSPWAGGIAYTTYLLSTFVSVWNPRLLTESLAASITVGLLWLTVRLREPLAVLLTGALLAWLVFLKPVALVPLAFLVASASGSGLVSLGTGVRLLLPFAVAESLWIARNLAVIGLFVPAQADENAGYVYRQSFLELAGLMQDCGADYISWDPRAEIRWFDPEAGQRRRSPVPKGPAGPLPPTLRKLGIAQSELELTRTLVLRSVDPETPGDVRDVADRQAAGRIRQHRQDFAAKHPFEKHLAARLRLVSRYLVRSGTETLFDRPFSELSPLKALFKVVQSFLYAGVLCTGIPAAALLLLARVRGHYDARLRPTLFVTAVFALFFTLAYPVVMRRAESRYMVPGLPACLLAAVCVGAFPGGPILGRKSVG